MCNQSSSNLSVFKELLTEKEPKNWNSLERVAQLMSPNLDKYPRLLYKYGKVS
jgi:hypothetical protein